MAVLRLTLWLLLLLLLPAPVPAQEPPPAEAVVAEEKEAIVFPGVSEVVPKTTLLGEEAARDAGLVAELRDVSFIESDLADLRSRQQELDARLAELGELAGWSVNTLLENRKAIDPQRKELEALLEVLATMLGELEQIHSGWNEKKNYWADWEASLTDPQIKVPRDAFRKAGGSITSILKDSATAIARLVVLQKRISSLQEMNMEVLGEVDALLDTLRKETFKKTALSLADPAYYRQFDQGLLRSVREGIAKVQWPDRRFLQEQGWVLALQIMVALFLWWTIRRYRNKEEPTEEWQFILRHPLATGIFVSVSTIPFLYAAPPGGLRLVLWVLAAFSASILISGVIINPRKIFMVYLLASLLVLSLGLRIIYLPQPLYRLYLAILALTGAPLLWWLAASNVRAKGGKLDGFTVALRAGALVLLATFFAQVSGYSNLSYRIIESSIESVFLGLFALMAVRLGRGGIEFLFDRELLRRYSFFRQFGAELASRLKRLFRVMVALYAVLVLLSVWGVYDTVGQAWDGLTAIGVTMGETEVTLLMVMLVCLVLYASMVLSWILQSLLEAGTLARTQLDRGIRDSIKRLLHYSVVLVAFLLAMNLVGMELKNFMVLAGAFGIGIGFGLQNIVNNFLSGIILLFERPVKVGDVVVIDDEWGRVRKIGLRSTIVETLDRAEIIVPNAMLVSEKVVNWSLTTTVARVVMPVGVAYGSDIELVLGILRETAEQHPDILDDPPPAPLFIGFGDSSLDFELRAWMADVNNRLRIRSELGQTIDRRFREQKVEIPFPQRDLHLRSVQDAVAVEVSQGTDSEGERE